MLDYFHRIFRWGADAPSIHSHTPAMPHSSRYVRTRFIKRSQPLLTATLVGVGLLVLSWGAAQAAYTQYRLYEQAHTGVNWPGLTTWHGSPEAACQGNGMAWNDYFIAIPSPTSGPWTEVYNAGAYLCDQYQKGVFYNSHHFETQTVDISIPKNGGCSNNLVSNPCNAATGNKYLTETDFIGSSDSPSMVRYYNSYLLQDFGLGYGWNFPFHRRLDINGTSAQIRQANGRSEPFSKNPSGQWLGEPDSRLTLTQDASGYTLTLRDRATERYNLNGKLLSEVDPTGKVTSYIYDTNGRLANITGSFGHTLSFPLKFVYQG